MYAIAIDEFCDAEGFVHYVLDYNIILYSTCYSAVLFSLANKHKTLFIALPHYGFHHC